MDSKDKKPDSSETPPGTMTKRELEELLGAKPPDTKEKLEKFDFEVLSKDVITSLRDCLRANGAYIKKGRGLSMAKELADVIKEEIPWPPDDEDRPPPKPSHYYPQQQPIQPQQPYQPYRPENTVPLPPQQPYQQPYRPENTVPLPPQPPYQPIVEDTTPVHPRPTPIVEDTTPVHPPHPSKPPPPSTSASTTANAVNSATTA
ncbi:hypothetical protein HO173_010517 [Letharia columbiana]|uniref:Uncharacterized protein n=1 Tax=Letharia columbiana TaxID=112416 RepID=A0A8H6FMF3_9LECA|nr:uncharacterized protein HO173_010517 [Letharia columbiana]KAF6231185.1 hypothetical protein HO173_010517 [Letharia columbiana]